MMVPITSQHRRNAQTLMNYYDPEVAAEVAAWVNYVCPVVGAREVLAKTDPSSPRAGSSSRARRSSRTTISKGSGHSRPREDQEYSAIWQKVMGN